MKTRKTTAVLDDALVSVTVNGKVIQTPLKDVVQRHEDLFRDMEKWFSTLMDFRKMVKDTCAIIASPHRC